MSSENPSLGSISLVVRLTPYIPIAYEHKNDFYNTNGDGIVPSIISLYLSIEYSIKMTTQVVAAAHHEVENVTNTGMDSVTSIDQAVSGSISVGWLDDWVDRY